MTQISPRFDKFLSDCTGDGVFYLGHASILARLSGRTFLFDPVSETPPYHGNWVFYPPQISDERFFQVNGVFISHCHQDHFDVSFLKQLGSDIPIYIVGGRPDFTRQFSEVGLRSPTQVPSGGKLDLGNGVEVHGVLHEYNTIDSSFVIKNDNFSVYHGNDNYLTEKTLRPLKDRVGDVHVGCVPFSFIHWYPFLLDGVDPLWRENEGRRLIEKYLDQGIEQSLTLDANVVIPFGANLIYHDDVDSVMNRACLSPIDFVEYAQSKHPQDSRFKTMFAGDYITKNCGDPIRPFCRKIARQEFLEGMKSFLATRNQNALKNELHVDPHLLDDLSWLEDKIKKHLVKSLDQLVLVSSQEERPMTVCIDLQSGKAERVKEWDKDRPFHLFKVEPVAMIAWLKRQISFEEVLGTRRFRLRRVPNEYNIEVLQILNNVL